MSTVHCAGCQGTDYLGRPCRGHECDPERIRREAVDVYKAEQAILVEQEYLAERRRVAEEAEQILGWRCPTSPTGRCYYTRSFEECDYCGQPEERK